MKHNIQRARETTEEPLTILWAKGGRKTGVNPCGVCFAPARNCRVVTFERLECCMSFRYKKGLRPRFSLAQVPQPRSFIEREKLMPSMTTPHAPKGLEGVGATSSKICYIDGDRGVLAYRDRHRYNRSWNWWRQLPQ